MPLKEFKLSKAQFQKTAHSAVFLFCGASLSCENVTLLAHRKEHFQVFGANFFGAALPQSMSIHVL